MRNKKTHPLRDVQKINYSFTPAQQNTGAGLKILTKADIARLHKLNEKPMEAFKDLFKSGNGPITLSITALNPVECLQLESWLQELILKKGNVTIQ